MMVIAAYDVSRDDRRARLAALLQSVGDRIQKSVFVLTVDQDMLDSLEEGARVILDLDEDSLYFFRLCAGCWPATRCIGQADAPERVLYWAAL